MLAFCNDYSEGCHPTVLKRLIDTNMLELPGYGSDDYSVAARQRIAEACHLPQAEVFLLSGGTQTNLIVIASLLRSYEGVICCSTGHIAVHEAGAIEATGHKVLTIPAKEGKLNAVDLEAYLVDFQKNASREHMVQPGMVYISQPTEYGTLYSKKELKGLHDVCKRNGLPLFVDGARLAYALACPENDVSLPDLSKLCDVFYFGGTKAGLLCGEAVVFPQGAPGHYLTFIKQHGALLAKGRLLGVQFDALFTDKLYLNIGKNAIVQADRIRAALKAKGYPFAIASPTNQIFVVLDAAKKQALAQQVWFDLWDNLPDGRTVIRLCTSWATTSEAVDQLIALL